MKLIKEHPLAFITSIFMLLGVVGFILDTRDPAKTMELIGLCGVLLCGSIGLGILTSSNK